MGDVIELFGSPMRSGGWTEQEKAELYRAASLLGARGLPFDTESGTTDDGDPWFLFIGRGTGEVLVHFARIEGMFVVHHAAADVVFEARDIRDLVDRVLVFPDRSIGRVSSDALHAHLAVTVAALGLSLEALSQFFDDADFDSVPLDDVAAAPASPSDAEAAWLLADDQDTPPADDDTVAGSAAVDRMTPDSEPGPQVHAVEVMSGEELSAKPEEAADTATGAVNDYHFGSDKIHDEEMFSSVPGSFNGAIIEGSTANDTLMGTAGADFLLGGEGHDLIIAGGGNDVVVAGGGDDTVLGGDGDDIVAGGDGNDLLYGGQGDDLLMGGAGNDMLYGGKGNDTLQGYLGHDTLSGDGGDDLLIASSGDAVLIGGDGANIFHFAPGDAVAYGGDDKDIFVYEEGERSNVVIHDFDPDQDELYYLDTAGHRVALEPASDTENGEVTLLTPNGGSLRIYFDDDPSPLIT